MDPVSAVGASWYAPVVPVILLVIMICMGMELALADFRRVLEVPRAAIVGLFGQMIMLPLMGLAFAAWPSLPPEIAIGIVIITACPGGATSNVFSYLARANTALSVTLTALSSTLCFVTIPLWIKLGIDLYGSDLRAGADSLHVPFGPTMAQLFIVTLLPAAIGMGIRTRWPDQSERVRGPLRRAMMILMALALVLIAGSEWESVLSNLEVSAGAALLLVCVMLAAAYGIARANRLGERDAFTISIEVGLQNGALATMLVASTLGRPELIVFPGSYAILSFVPVSAWTLAMRRRIAA